MTSAVLLLTYAVAAGTLGAGWLRDARWTHLTPRLAIAAWQALAASILLALAAAGLAMTVTLPHVRTDLALLVDLCAENVVAGYASPGGAAAALIGITAFLALAARTAWCVARTIILEHRERATRITLLDLVARRDVLSEALVVEHAAPYAFCIGGRRHRVVVTTGLLQALTPAEIEAVLAHEAAHLRQRHHLALLGCRVLFATLTPLFPTFGRATPDVRLFAELCADDSARSRVNVSHLRSALATLACTPAPAGTLAASGSDVAARLRRLDQAPRRLGLGARTFAVVGIGTAVLIPLTLAAAPVLTMVWEGICLLG